MFIRESTDSDVKAIIEIQLKAFGQDIEANLVLELINDQTAEPKLSLIALNETKAVGHILFTKAYLEPEQPISASILAPLAVIPEFQRQGVGGSLIKQGLKTLRDSGIDLVFVLGHIQYYPRFGFRPAGKLGFDSPYPIPEKVADAWMVQELQSGVIGKCRGRVICADPLNKPELWRE